MELWLLVKEFVLENTAMITACGLVFVALLLAAIFVVKTGKSGIYFAVCAMAGGGFALFLLGFDVDFTQGAYTSAGLCVAAGTVYFFAVCGWIYKQKSWERCVRRFERARKLQYGLPDRDNTYVQARLNTVLRTETDENGLAVTERVDLGYARKMLSAVLEKPLSAGERLQAEDIGKSLGVYFQKPRWSAADLRAVNDVFSVLMKLCTKYSVGCEVSSTN